jgi:hypothetical protein
LSQSVHNMDLITEGSAVNNDANKLFNTQSTDFTECLKYHQFLSQINLTDIRKVMSSLFRQALESIDNSNSMDQQFTDFKRSLVCAFYFYKLKYFIKDSKLVQGRDFSLLIKCRNSQQKRERIICSCPENIKIMVNKNDPDAVNKAVLMFPEVMQRCNLPCNL